MSSLLAKLNPEQKRAVITTEGPLLILAGAGSGKTRVLTHRIAHIIQENGVTPESILAVTFTNKAAKEMLERTENLLSRTLLASGRPLIATFHSLGVRVLRRQAHHLGWNNDFTIYDSDDQKKLLKAILKELDIDEKYYNTKAILGAISGAKNNFISPRVYENDAENQFQHTVARVYPLYQKYLQQNQAMDFDDLLLNTARLFREQQHILDFYQQQFSYFMIDEYQDTNQLQYLISNALAAQSRNLCVVGDDDQSIYSWRGANIKNILDFEADYPEATVIKLEQNYRSTKNILAAAGAIIKNNSKRKKKVLWTENIDGNAITYATCPNEYAEARFISREMLRLHAEEHIPFHEMAILYRTNVQSRALEEACIREGIPYHLVGGTKFYERREIKDVLAYLRFLINPYDRISFERSINLPPRGIGKTALQHFFDYHRQQITGNFNDSLQQVQDIPGLQPTAKKGFARFHELCENFRAASQQLPLPELLDLILEEARLAEFIRDGSEEGEERYANVMELRNVMLEYSELLPGQALSHFLEEVALLTDLDSIDPNRSQVTLITLHAVKGLEYDVVFMSGMEQGLFPHSRCLQDKAGMEEERRLCYVGITRAKKHLYLSRAEERHLYTGAQLTLASQFLEDLPAEHLNPVSIDRMGSFLSQPRNTTKIIPTHSRKNSHTQSSTQSTAPKLNTNTTSFAEGDSVQHKTFGKGVIIQIKNDELTIAFEEGNGIKKLLASMAPLEKL